MLFSHRSVQNSKALIIIGRASIYSIQMLADGGI